MNRLSFKKLELEGLFEILQNPIKDKRGYLSRVFCNNEISKYGFSNAISQINTTLTLKKGTIRGLHFQRYPATDTKIILCLKGSIFDVVVDIRKDSPTFLKWISLELSCRKKNMILINKGFAHGFQTLSDDVELLYFHDHEYVSTLDTTINPFDPSINIKWPLDKSCISEKDLNGSFISNSNFIGI